MHLATRMKRVLRRYPLLLPLLALIAGITMAYCVEERASIRFSILLLLIAGLFWVFALQSPSGWALVFFVLGWWQTGPRFFEDPPQFLQSWVRKEAWVAVRFSPESYCEAAEGGFRFTGHILGHYQSEAFFPSTFPAVFFFSGGRCDLQPGAVYRTLVRFREPQNFKNPGVFSYAQSLRAKKIFYTVTLHDSIEWIQERPPNFQQIWVGSVRARLQKVLDHSLEDPWVRGFFGGLLIKDDSAMGEEGAEVFRATGLSHLLVVSGMNLGIVYGLAYLVLIFPFSLWRRAFERGWSRRGAAFFAVFPTWAYAMMVGYEPSVNRALAACMGVGLARTLGLRPQALSLFLMVAWIFLLNDPGLLWDLSFQLSFMATGFLVLFSPLLAKAFRERQGAGWFHSNLGEKIWSGVWTALLVGIGLYPLMAIQFHRFSWVSPLSNLLMVPPFMVVGFPLVVLAGVLALLYPPGGAWLFKILEIPFHEVLAWLRLLATWSWIEGPVASPSWGVWIAYVGFFVGVWRFSQGRSLFRTWGLSLALALLFCLLGAPVGTPLLELRMLDVGQGEALLLKLPSGETLLIDGGGFPRSKTDVGARVVLPVLWSQGIFELSEAILTHPDEDHFLGLVSVLSELRVQNFYYPAVFQKILPSALTQILEQHTGIVKTLKRGDAWKLGGVRFEVLWPPAISPWDAEDGDNSKNNLSLVLKVSYGQVCWLLTGDLETPAEFHILAQEDPQRLHCELLKVGHHGSKTSSSDPWLDAVQPRWGLISAGMGNRFALPHSQVLARLFEKGISIWRTDRDGQIRVFTDGKTSCVQSYIERDEVGDKCRLFP